MSRYILIRRLRGPVLLLLIGVLALLHQAHVIDNFWHLFWPLLLIAFGLQLLAERAVLSAEDGYSAPFPGSPYTGAPSTGVPSPAAAPAASQPAAQPESAIVRTHWQELDKDHEGGQS
jgi:hypothetical protein